MILDSHIHMSGGKGDPKDFEARLAEAGVDGGIILSPRPASFFSASDPPSASERIGAVLDWTRDRPNLFPFFWIDPLEDGAIEQAGEAVERGVSGFKVICGAHEPGHPKAMDVYRAIAAAGKPILFHSGILWDGKPSGTFNRPVMFEPLMEVAGLRFAMAHISWPWVDECIAVYGKMLNAAPRRGEAAAEMFIDLTPGTPPIYRAEALTKIFTVGYDVENNVMYGSDSRAEDYGSAWAKQWIERDKGIYDTLDMDPSVREKVFSRNLLRFVGEAKADVQHKAPVPGE